MKSYRANAYFELLLVAIAGWLGFFSFVVSYYFTMSHMPLQATSFGLMCGVTTMQAYKYVERAGKYFDLAERQRALDE